MKMPRKVFGRIKRKIDGADYVIELRTDGLRVRRKWARAGTIVDLERLIRLVEGRLF
jgi:hypothetical protein